MSHAGRFPISGGLTPHFGVVGGDLNICLVGKHCRYLIPENLLQGHLPTPILGDHFCWYNAETKLVEFCAIAAPFDFENAIWKIRPASLAWEVRYG
jgi:hypothetical protein